MRTRALSKSRLLGVGIDILSLDRFQRLLDHRGAQRLAQRILSPLEQQQFQTLEPFQHLHFLGTRFSLKEALYKALYPSYALNWLDVSILKSNGIYKPIHYQVGSPECN